MAAATEQQPGFLYGASKIRELTSGGDALVVLDGIFLRDRGGRGHYQHPIAAYSSMSASKRFTLPARNQNEKPITTNGDPSL
jgi:hypothetical protein